MKKFKFTFNTRFYFTLEARSMGEAYEKFNKLFPTAKNVELRK